MQTLKLAGGCTATIAQHALTLSKITFSKAFEKLVYLRVVDCFLFNGFITDQQFGCLIHRSTVWQLLSVTEEWQ